MIQWGDSVHTIDPESVAQGFTSIKSFSFCRIVSAAAAGNLFGIAFRIGQAGQQDPAEACPGCAWGSSPWCKEPTGSGWLFLGLSKYMQGQGVLDCATYPRDSKPIRTTLKTLTLIRPRNSFSDFEILKLEW